MLITEERVQFYLIHRRGSPGLLFLQYEFIEIVNPVVAHADRPNAGPQESTVASRRSGLCQ